MSTLFIIFVVIALGIFGVLEWYKIRLQVVPRKTPPEIISALVSILGVPENEEDLGGSILHLGSGWGDLVINLAKRLPAWEIDGLEQNPSLWLLSNMRSIGKDTSNFRFFIGNYTTYSLRNHEMIFINQDQKTVARWEASIGRRLPIDTMVVTLNSRLPRVRPINVIQVTDKMTLYVYEKRAKETAPSTDVVPQPYAVDQSAPAFTSADLTPSLQPELPLNPQMVPEPPVPQPIQTVVESAPTPPAPTTP